MRSLYSLRAFKAAFALAQILPRPVTRKIADTLAGYGLRHSPELAKITRENLAVTTGLSGEGLDALVCENFRCFSRMLADYFLCAGDRAFRATELLDATEGSEHLAAAQAAGRGTILITGHLGHWELGGLLLALHGLRMTVITLPEPSEELTRWRGACRERLGIGTIAVGPGHDFAFVEMLRTLRENGCLAMLVDRPYEGTGIAVRQFGHITQYSTAAAMLAHHTGAAVVPAFVIRLPNHRYRAITCPPVQMSTGPLRDTMQENTQRIADVFEVLIRQHPDQWFNYVPLFQNP
ncbi:MAG: lysophospholipid acyltransferase family protein [Chthoniobacteraceae bacterium]